MKTEILFQSDGRLVEAFYYGERDEKLLYTKTIVTKRGVLRKRVTVFPDGVVDIYELGSFNVEIVTLRGIVDGKIYVNSWSYFDQVDFNNLDDAVSYVKEHTPTDCVATIINIDNDREIDIFSGELSDPELLQKCRKALL